MVFINNTFNNTKTLLSSAQLDLAPPPFVVGSIRVVFVVVVVVVVGGEAAAILARGCVRLEAHLFAI